MQLYLDVHDQLPEGAGAQEVSHAHGLVPDRIYPVVEGL